MTQWRATPIRRRRVRNMAELTAAEIIAAMEEGVRLAEEVLRELGQEYLNSLPEAERGNYAVLEKSTAEIVPRLEKFFTNFLDTVAGWGWEKVLKTEAGQKLRSFAATELVYDYILPYIAANLFVVKIDDLKNVLARALEKLFGDLMVAAWTDPQASEDFYANVANKLQEKLGAAGEGEAKTTIHLHLLSGRTVTAEVPAESLAKAYTRGLPAEEGIAEGNSVMTRVLGIVVPATPAHQFEISRYVAVNFDETSASALVGALKEVLFGEEEAVPFPQINPPTLYASLPIDIIVEELKEGAQEKSFAFVTTPAEGMKSHYLNFACEAHFDTFASSLAEECAKLLSKDTSPIPLSAHPEVPPVLRRLGESVFQMLIAAQLGEAFVSGEFTPNFWKSLGLNCWKVFL